MSSDTYHNMNKTIVVTGASTGIGLATTELCLKAGHKVIATARNPEDMDRLRKLGAIPVKAEFTELPSVEQAASEILALSDGHIDALFNNAGYGLQIAIEDTTWESLSEQHTVNVIAPVQLTNLLLPGLKRGSKLIFNTSILGVITIPFRGPYCMSKHALEAAADAFRLELEPLAIDVRILEPGPIEANFRPRVLSMLKKVLGNKRTRLDYSNHIARLGCEGNTKGTLPAQSCASVILDIMEGRNKRYRNLVTGVAKQAAFMKRLLGSGFHIIARKAEPVREVV